MSLFSIQVGQKRYTKSERAVKCFESVPPTMMPPTTTASGNMLCPTAATIRMKQRVRICDDFALPERLLLHSKLTRTCTALAYVGGVDDRLEAP